ncbi:MAG: electron transfer flavoprotein-ubiquinone oxidoreductase [Acidobacteriota bacterium]|nr:MAG: electron transfer flavoprotein-ubiquinone oxidoreductase [Acidobacteriota bacterium]
MSKGNDVRREVLDADVLFVGGGPASLAGAVRLKQLVDAHNAAVEGGEKQGGRLDPVILVIEKGAHMGAHGISGAVMDPRALEELLPDHMERGFPLESRVTSDDVAYLTKRRAWKLPFVPRFLDNRGHYVVSLSRVAAWLSKQAEAMDVQVFPEFAGARPLLETCPDACVGGKRLIGVRTGDKGVGADGKRKANFEPGVDIHAEVTVVGEGPRGTITKVLADELKLDAGKNPQVYSIGVKEVWEVRPENHEKGRVLHTMGWPLGGSVYGGAFVYHMDKNLVSLGLVVGLDYANPYLDPQVELQRLKRHPRIAKVLEGGECVQYGAKTIPEGGWFSVPRLYGEGFMLAGDSAGLLDSRRLKGIHLAMKSGMLAAETAFETLVEKDSSARVLSRYAGRVERSWIKEELWPVRNFHQCFKGGLLQGIVRSSLHSLLGGRGFLKRLPTRPDPSYYGRAGDFDPACAVDKYDDRLTFDKPKCVYLSGAIHSEDQPAHLHVADTEVCVTRCREEFKNPCERFCPAKVYEIVEDAGAPRGLRLQINFSNCVHCKTCDIKDPYQIITWVTPEGGGGPRYSVL